MNQIYKELLFVFPKSFNRKWRKLGFGYDDKENLKRLISEYVRHAVEDERSFKFPGDLVSGTGGAIKMRFDSERSDQGKSGSYRIIYFVMVENEIRFLKIYAKKDEANSSDEDRNLIHKYIKNMRRER
ncbi:type II toxin-antitoxin system RelE/ParE family toxin [Lentilactobacillus otakiensis]|uniref:type II toxin-antitoxin system RelE/ParE family toxin n=1 Tax=Lentilactobacillus otakiensis TaxID=481720 RepID=UPI003D166591